MKNTIKILICLLTISSILIYAPLSKAAEADCTIQAVNSAYAVAIDSSMGNTDNMQSTVTFSLTTNVRCKVNPVDGYYTGHYRFTISYSPAYALGNGWTLHGQQVYCSLTDPGDSTYRIGIIGQPTDNSITISVYFYNYPCFNSTNIINLGTFTWLFSYYTTNTPNVASMPDSVLCNKTYTYVTDFKYFTAVPATTQYYALIYKQIIMDALAAGNLDDVYTYLVNWKTTQDGYLADIELSVDDLEDILTAMAGVVDSISTTSSNTYTKVNQIYTLLSQIFPTYSNSVLNKLDQIINMHSNNTEAQASGAAAEAALSQAVNNLDVAKPNISNVVNAGDSYLNQDIQNAQGDTFFWLHGSNILVIILTMSVTVGIIGFVIYGKSG